MSDNANMLVVMCPSCKHRMKAPGEALGRATRCVSCGARFTISRENAARLPSSGTPTAMAGRTETVSRSDEGKLPLRELLLQATLVTEDQLHEADAACRREGGALTPVLLQKGFITIKALETFLASQRGLARIDLRMVTISPGMGGILSKEFCESHCVMPIDALGKLLTLAMICPLDRDTIEEVQRGTGMRVNAVLCKLDDLKAGLVKLFPPAAAKGGAEADFTWLTGPLILEEENEPEPTPESAPEPSPEPTPESAIAPPAAPPTPETRPTFASFEADYSVIRDHIITAINELTILPPCPDVLERSREMMTDPHYPTRDAAVICGVDPAFVARLLSLTNSPAYGVPGRVDNANLAATLLGASGVLRVVKACASAPGVPPEAEFDYEAFSLRSAFCSAVAQALAKASGKAPHAAAATAGLLHKLGMLALAVVAADSYGDMDWALRGSDRLRAERRLFGLTVAEAGQAICRNWRLPLDISDAVRLHERPDQASERGALAAAVAIGASMAEAHEHHGSPELFEQIAPALPVLSLDIAAAQQVFHDTSMIFGG